MHRLEVEARNTEYAKLAESRNFNASDVADVRRLVDLKVKIKTGYLSKSTKQAFLNEVRTLEARLGIKGDEYNSSAF